MPWVGRLPTPTMATFLIAAIEDEIEDRSFVILWRNEISWVRACPILLWKIKNAGIGGQRRSDHLISTLLTSSKGVDSAVMPRILWNPGAEDEAFDD